MDSLTLGIIGLANLGQVLGFVFMPDPPPLEFPKMLYRGNQAMIVHNAADEARANAEGWWAREAIPAVEAVVSPPVPPPNPPTVRFPK